MDDMGQMAQRLRAVRAAAGFSQLELAAYLGASLRTVQRWECGQSAPAWHQVAALARLDPTGTILNPYLTT